MRFTKSLHAILLTACLLVATTGQTATDPRPPAMKLGDVVRPLAYKLDLTVLPDATGFDGKVEVEIDLDLQRPLDFFWMNGRQLEIRRATLLVDGKLLAASTVAAGGDFIGVRLPQVVPAGRARLAIEYGGQVSSGMKRVRFATTAPLPTYLVALGVGPFDVVDGGTAGINQTPLR